MHEALMIVLGTALVGAAALAQNAGPRPDPTHNPAANSAASKPNAGVPRNLSPKGAQGQRIRPREVRQHRALRAIRRPACSHALTIPNRALRRNRRHAVLQ
jgi:hypothetical protein